MGGCPGWSIQDLWLYFLIWILEHYDLKPFPSCPFDKSELPQANPVSTVAPEKLPQALKTQFCWINWTKGEELAHPTVWVLDHVLFLLLPEEYSHSDLLPLVFVTSKVGDTSPSKEAVLHSLENCSSCLCLAYFGLWIPKRTKMPLQKSYLCCHICPFPIHSPGIPAEYSWKGELQYYAEPRCNRLRDQQHSPVRREKVLPYHAWKCLKKDIEFLNFWFKMRAGV